jgi:hypothetical protein
MFYLNKMIKNKNKKGSHVGMVLSFTIFITFLIFAYIIIGPPAIFKNEIKYTIEPIKKNVFEKLFEEIIIIRAYDTDNSGGCIQFDINNPFTLSQVLVKNSNGIEINSSLSGETISIEGGQGFMKIYLSNSSFEKENTWTGDSCVTISPKNILEEERITEKKIINLINLTENHYDEAKEYLNIRKNEFSLHFMYNNSHIIGKEKVLVDGIEEIKTNIYARTFKIDYLDINGEEKIGGFIIKTW